MALPSWPEALHHRVLRDGWQVEPARLPVATEVEDGPDLMRDQARTRIMRMRTRIVLDDAQRAVFEAFVMGDLAGGTAHFLMPVPIAGPTYDERRVYIERGRWSIEPRGLRWALTMTLCVFPAPPAEED